MSIQPTKEEALPSTLYNKKGEINRPASLFRNWISNEPGARFPAEKGRYHLYVSYACPWAHRTLITRALKSLPPIISVTSLHPHLIFTDSWRFVTSNEDPPLAADFPDCHPDPLHENVTHIKDLYLRADPNYTGRFTVPVLWDKKAETIVSNESSEIIRMLNGEFEGVLAEESGKEKREKVDLYPEELRKEIDEANAWIYDNVNNGVYKCGLAKTQPAYNSALNLLFTSLTRIESQLSHGGPYYFDHSLTETDIRLYVTIIRFDVVYSTLFKTNLHTIRGGEFPNIHKWVRNLYWNFPAFRETTSFEHIKGHYFRSLVMVNPYGVVPGGPVPDVLPLEKAEGKEGERKVKA